MKRASHNGVLSCASEAFVGVSSHLGQRSSYDQGVEGAPSWARVRSLATISSLYSRRERHEHDGTNLHSLKWGGTYWSHHRSIGLPRFLKWFFFKCYWKMWWKNWRKRPEIKFFIEPQNYRKKCFRFFSVTSLIDRPKPELHFCWLSLLSKTSLPSSEFAISGFRAFYYINWREIVVCRDSNSYGNWI
jgi:hypothetical protein